MRFHYPKGLRLARVAQPLSPPRTHRAIQAAVGLLFLNLAILHVGDGALAGGALTSAWAARGGAASAGSFAFSSLIGDGAVTIVAACKGKHNTLLAAVDSWLQVRHKSLTRRRSKKEKLKKK
jgi:hypothetical protein